MFLGFFGFLVSPYPAEWGTCQVWAPAVNAGCRSLSMFLDSPLGARGVDVAKARGVRVASVATESTKRLALAPIRVVVAIDEAFFAEHRVT